MLHEFFSLRTKKREIGPAETAPNQPAAMADRIAPALAKADSNPLNKAPGRYCRLAIAALQSLLTPPTP